MKKLFYIVLVVVALLVVAQVVKTRTAQEKVAPAVVDMVEITVEDNQGNVTQEEDVIVVPEETFNDSTATDDIDETAPDQTAHEEETIVKE